jgi:hypothetical protein
VTVQEAVHPNVVAEVEVALGRMVEVAVVPIVSASVVAVRVVVALVVVRVVVRVVVMLVVVVTCGCDSSIVVVDAW